MLTEGGKRGRDPTHSLRGEEKGTEVIVGGERSICDCVYTHTHTHRERERAIHVRRGSLVCGDWCRRSELVGEPRLSEVNPFGPSSAFSARAHTHAYTYLPLYSLPHFLTFEALELLLPLPPLVFLFFPVFCPPSPSLPFFSPFLSPPLVPVFPPPLSPIHPSIHPSLPPSLPIVLFPPLRGSGRGLSEGGLLPGY